MISSGSRYAEYIQGATADALLAMPDARRNECLARAFCQCPVVTRIVRGALYRAGADTQETEPTKHECWMLLQTKYQHILLRSDDTLAVARAAAINFARERVRRDRAAPITVSISVIEGHDAVKSDFAAFGNHVRASTANALGAADEACDMAGIAVAHDYVSSYATEQARHALRAKLGRINLPQGTRRAREDAELEVPPVRARRGVLRATTAAPDDRHRLTRLRIITGVDLVALRAILGWDETHWNDVMSCRVGSKYEKPRYRTVRESDLASLTEYEANSVSAEQAAVYTDTGEVTGVELLLRWHRRDGVDHPVTIASCRNLARHLLTNTNLHRWLTRPPEHASRYAACWQLRQAS